MIDAGCGEGYYSNRIASLDGFCVYDLKNEYAIDVSEFASMGRCTPFEGKRVLGKCMATVSGGKIAYLDEKLLKNVKN